MPDTAASSSNEMESIEERQKWLDNNQYTPEGILRYERVYGDDFISPGGRETTEKLVTLLSLRPGMKVLDIGCGVGGAVFHMAEHFGVVADGVDLSTNMLQIAQSKLESKYSHLKDRVNFKLADCMVMDVPENSYDAIYSKDVILHIQDKTALFARLYKWLKPGGKLLITDYCHGEKHEHSQEYAEYVEKRKYHLFTVTEYAHILQEIFPEVWSDDRTNSFIKVLRKEIAHLKQHRDSFVKDFSENDFNDLIGAWEAKVARATDGYQAWGLFLATKH